VEVETPKLRRSDIGSEDAYPPGLDGFSFYKDSTPTELALSKGYQSYSRISTAGKAVNGHVQRLKRISRQFIFASTLTMQSVTHRIPP